MTIATEGAFILEDDIIAREQAARSRAEASERRARFLADAARRLADALEYDAALSLAAELAVPALGDACAVDAYEDGAIRRAAVQAEGGLELPPDAIPLLSEELALRVLRAREPLLLPSRLVVPLVARGRAVGALTVVQLSDGQRGFARDDLPFALDLAGRMALAIDNAKLMRARDDMLAVVSHDLRNPLNVIVFATSSLKRGTLTDEQRASYVLKIRRAADRMNRLIQDLLDVTRLEGDKLVMERAPCVPAGVLSDVAEAIRPLADEKQIQLVVEASVSLPHVLVDRERVLQAFSNLLGNAIKFTPKGGRIVLGAREAGGEVVFKVQDSGPGIAPEHLGRIFDRFWQARRRDKQGAGLGLAIARGLVMANEGRIWVESRPGEGAIFQVALPVAPHL